MIGRRHFGELVIWLGTDTGAATLINAGTIAPASSSASAFAIYEKGGGATIDNTGTIIGEVALASTMFNNESGGIWDVSGNNIFGSGSTVNNAGVINALPNSNGFTTTINAALNNTGSVEVHAGQLDITGAVAGDRLIQDR